MKFRRRIRRPLAILALALVTMALAVPTALAVPAEDFFGPVDTGSSQAYPDGSKSSATPRPPVTANLDDGFDWGAAGIGAAAAATLILLSLVGLGATSRVRCPCAATVATCPATSSTIATRRHAVSGMRS